MGNWGICKYCGNDVYWAEVDPPNGSGIRKLPFDDNNLDICHMDTCKRKVMREAINSSILPDRSANYQASRGIHAERYSSKPLKATERGKSKKERGCNVRKDEICPYCNHKFTIFFGLLLHIRAKHPEDFEKYLLKKDVKQKLLSKSGEKIKICHICGAPIKNLKKHIRKKHDNEIVDPSNDTKEFNCSSVTISFNSNEYELILKAYKKEKLDEKTLIKKAVMEYINSLNIG
jgi:hypothetical protein